VVGALPVPHLPAGVARIFRDGGDGPERPARSGAVAVAAGVVGGGGDAAVVEGAGDARGAGPAEALREDPSDVRSGRRVGVEAVQAASPVGVFSVWVPSGIGEPVAIGWSAAEVASLVTGLGAHGIGGAHPGAEDLAFGLMAEQHDQRPVSGVVEIDGSVGFGQPQWHAVELQQRDDVVGLAAGEGAFVFADQEGVEGPVRVGGVLQRGGKWPQRQPNIPLPGTNRRR